MIAQIAGWDMLRTLIMAGALVCAANAHAQSMPIVDGPALVGPPPAAGSPRDAADRLSMRAPVSAERFAQAQADLRYDPWTTFRAPMGERFVRERLPRTAALLARVTEAVEPPVDAAKTHYARTRPYVEDISILRCDAPANPSATNSYPTGHGAAGWAWALTLAELSPSRANAILERGRAFGDSRVICGYHFPSDVDAARVIAAAVIARLHADAGFRREVDAARREIARAGLS
jgi:acid phosphatase (class A)